jgi:hypothetical protein
MILDDQFPPLAPSASIQAQKPTQPKSVQKPALPTFDQVPKPTVDSKSELFEFGQAPKSTADPKVSLPTFDPKPALTSAAPVKTPIKFVAPPPGFDLASF